MRKVEPTGDPLFDRFWAAYPKKADKPESIKAFKKLKVDEAFLEVLLEAIKLHTKVNQWDNRKRRNTFPTLQHGLITEDGRMSWMEQIQSLIQELHLGLKLPDAAPSLNDWEDMQLKLCNEREGDLTGYQCSECRNKGYIYSLRDGEMIASECRCMKIRSTLLLIQRSSLSEQLRHCKFDNFETPEPWQQTMKSAAIEYIRSNATGFFLGGQTGCGKTHLCTAIVGSMIKKGLSARYFVWREDATSLKAIINESEYTIRMQEYKKTDCLYIDDLFKGGATPADIKLAFELIDYRARNGKRTIISTELTEDALIREDEALAGRIFRMATGFRMVIPKDTRKNYRLR